MLLNTLVQMAFLQEHDKPFVKKKKKSLWISDRKKFKSNINIQIKQSSIHTFKRLKSSIFRTEFYNFNFGGKFRIDLSVDIGRWVNFKTMQVWQVDCQCHLTLQFQMLLLLKIRFLMILNMIMIMIVRNSFEIFFKSKINLHFVISLQSKFNFILNWFQFYIQKFKISNAGKLLQFWFVLSFFLKIIENQKLIVIDFENDFDLSLLRFYFILFIFFKQKTKEMQWLWDKEFTRHLRIHYQTFM